MAEAATIARPYAKAAFMSARDAAQLAGWSRALELAAGMIADARVAELASDPRIAAERVVSLFAGLAPAAAEAHWENFVHLLATNKRLELLPEIATQFGILRAGYENELDVQVTSAAPIDAPGQEKLAAALRKRFKRDVRMTLGVDPALLGGAVIRAGDLVIDGSINGRLQRLASELGN